MLLDEMSDEDLIFLIKSGSKVAEQVFYNRYSKNASELAKTYYIEFKDTGIPEEDFFSVAFSKTHQALLKFANRRKGFYSYWRAVVKNAVYDLVRDNSYSLGARSLGDTSLDDTRYDNNEKMMFHDIYGEDENQATLVEVVENVIYGDSHHLTDEEKLMADLLLFKELKPGEIMKLTNWSRGHTSYLIRVVKSKIQEIIKENYL